jgi:hypothetical protein
MQFGKFHAVAFLMLGVLLLLVQVYVVFEGRANVAQTSPPDQTTETGPQTVFTRPNRIDYLPGALGFALVAFGGYVMLQGRKKRLAEETRDLGTHDSSHGLAKHG